MRQSVSEKRMKGNIPLHFELLPYWPVTFVLKKIDASKET